MRSLWRPRVGKFQATMHNDARYILQNLEGIEGHKLHVKTAFGYQIDSQKQAGMAIALPDNRLLDTCSMSSGTICCQFKRQSVVALLVCEAEFMCQAQTTKEGVWL